jgi:signal transduction histidine kinase
MMIGFSVFLISHENTVQEMDMTSHGFLANNIVTDILREYKESNHQFNDLIKFKKELANKSDFFTMSGAEAAIYSSDYKLLFQTNDYWVSNYFDKKGANNSTREYGYSNPHEWFSQQEIDEIETYLYSSPQVEKVGDLSGYFVRLDRFWVENEMIIPEKITVTAMYAISIGEDGSVTSSNRDYKTVKVYMNDYQNTKDLPQYEYSFINRSNKYYNNQAIRNELRKIVIDENKLKEAVQFLGVANERINLFTYRYYLVLPYQNYIITNNINNNSSEFWTVFARQVNLWEECSSILYMVWGPCFLIFFVVAIILSRQTVKTYQKRDQLELQRQEMTNALAHDLKTPLSIISGYTQNLIENIHTEKREYYAGKIQDNVTRMDKIIKEMLEVSRLEDGLYPSKTEELSLNLISLEIMNRYQQVSEENSIKTLLEGDALVLGDESFIIRVIDNFYINALEHTKVGGSIQITINDSVFEIFNSGSHVPDDMLDEIWLPYKKVDESRSNTKGTGLGLSIARTILDYYNYSYGVRNTEDGVVFWFRLQR